MDIHRTPKVGPALEDEAYEVGGDTSTGDVGIVKSTTSGEIFAYRAEAGLPTDEYAADVEPVSHSPIKAATLLFDHVNYGEIWGSDGRKALVGQPYDPTAEDLIGKHTKNSVEVISGVSEYMYIDDMSARGGMMYHKGDFQNVDGYLFTRPEVQEDPKPYIEALLEQGGPTDASLIEDTSALENLGFRRKGEYVDSTRGSEPSLSLSKSREMLEDEGKEVIFFATGGHHNPHRTKLEIWTRPKASGARSSTARATA